MSDKYLTSYDRLRKVVNFQSKLVKYIHKRSQFTGKQIIAVINVIKFAQIKHWKRKIV